MKSEISKEYRPLDFPRLVISSTNTVLQVTSISDCGNYYTGCVVHPGNATMHKLALYSDQWQVKNFHHFYGTLTLSNS